MKRVAALGGLLLLTLASGLGLVGVREEARQLDLAARKERDRIRRMETEWGRLQLERAALAARSRVERLARERFRMRIPEPDETWDFQP